MFSFADVRAILVRKVNGTNATLLYMNFYLQEDWYPNTSHQVVYFTGLGRPKRLSNSDLRAQLPSSSSPIEHMSSPLRNKPFSYFFWGRNPPPLRLTSFDSDWETVPPECLFSSDIWATGVLWRILIWFGEAKNINFPECDGTWSATRLKRGRFGESHSVEESPLTHQLQVC